MRGNALGAWAIFALALVGWFIRLASKVPEEFGRLNNIKVFKPELYRVEVGAYIFSWIICLFLILIVIGPYFYIKYAYR